MLSERLKSLRLEAKITQKEISDKLKISQPSYAQWEKGIRVPNIERLQELSKILNTSTDYLLGNTDNKKALSFDDLKEAIINSKTFNHRPLTDAERNEIIKLIEDKLK